MKYLDVTLRRQLEGAMRFAGIYGELDVVAGNIIEIQVDAESDARILMNMLAETEKWENIVAFPRKGHIVVTAAVIEELNQ